MIKRVLCVIMCCVFMAALSLSVFAVDYPINNVDGTVYIRSFSLTILNGGGTTEYLTPTWNFPFGSLGVFFIAKPSDDDYYANVEVDFTIEMNHTFTVYVPIYTSYPEVSGSYNFGDLAQYRDTSSDFVMSSVGTVSAYVGSASGSPISVGTMSYRSVDLYNEDIRFICFKNVPPGSYDVSIYYENTSGTTGVRSLFGCYVSVTSTIFEDFENGYINFSEAIEQINQELQEILDSDASDSEKLIAIEIASQDIERIKQISDVKYNTVVNDYVDETDKIISDFQSGSISIQDAIDDLQMEYFDALSQAVTAEQGIYLNTANTFQINKLHLLWQIDFYNNLEEIVPDEKHDEHSEVLSDLDKKYEEEAEVLANFDLAEYESYLEFSLWTDTLGDYSSYRSIFEYFFEENKAFTISQFLVVPFSLVLVSVLLATTTVVIGGFSRYHDSYGTKPFSFRRGGKR